MLNQSAYENALGKFIGYYLSNCHGPEVIKNFLHAQLNWASNCNSS